MPTLSREKRAEYRALATTVAETYRDEQGVEEERLASEAVPALLAELDEMWRVFREVHAALVGRDTASYMPDTGDIIRNAKHLHDAVERLTRALPPVRFVVPSSDAMRLSVMEAMKAEMQPIVRVAEDADALRAALRRVLPLAEKWVDAEHASSPAWDDIRAARTALGETP